jgi:hypothetical protein
MDFLKEVGIKYEREKKITGLKGDTKPFRIADFYLPKYNAYIEFMGLWNKNVKDEDYKAKKLAYRNNGIPCVYLYPENLGVLHFSLDYRLQKALSENGKYKELNRYRRFKLFKARWLNMLLIVFGILLLYVGVYNYYNNDNEHTAYIFLGSSLIIYQSFRVIAAYMAIFIKKKFSLLKVMQDSAI